MKGLVRTLPEGQQGGVRQLGNVRLFSTGREMCATVYTKSEHQIILKSDKKMMC